MKLYTSVEDRSKRNVVPAIFTQCSNASTPCQHRGCRRQITSALSGASRYIFKPESKYRANSRCELIRQIADGFRLFVLDPPRDELYARINERTEGHFAAGLVEEVKHLLKSGVKDNTNTLRAHGYRPGTRIFERRTRPQFGYRTVKTRRSRLYQEAAYMVSTRIRGSVATRIW